MNPMIREAIVRGDANITLSINAADLRAIMGEMALMERKRLAEEAELLKQKPAIGLEAAAEMLGVSRTTLYNWEKSGYLIPVRIGRKVLYRAADIEEISAKTQQSNE